MTPSTAPWLTSEAMSASKKNANKYKYNNKNNKNKWCV